MERYDVAVLGGGSAGVAAAWSAAVRGARTVLVEASDVLTGNAAQAFVHTICGLYESGEAGGATARTLHPGFPRLFAESLSRSGAAGVPERGGRVFYLPIDPERAAQHAARVLAAAPGLDVLLRARVRDVAHAAGGYALGLDRDTPRSVAASFLLDTSGSAVAAAQLGRPTRASAPDRLQHPSYIARVRGIQSGALEGFGRLRVSHAIAGAMRSGALPAACGSVLVRPGGEAARGDAFLQLNVPKLPDRDYEPDDPGYREALERAARADFERVFDHLRATRPEFGEARVVAWPRHIGIRETRRIEGSETVVRDDVLSGRLRDDEVARSGWPIELWNDHRRASFEHPEGPCSVPLGALVCAGEPRLGAAGRCLSADHDALGALRVIGTALATGEALGVAAARAADRGVDLAAIAPAEIRDDISNSSSWWVEP